MTSPQRTWQFWTLPLVHLTLAIGLLAYHTHAENTTITADDDEIDLWNRILSGPVYWTSMDKLCFFVLIMLGMDFLGWLIRNSGGGYLFD
jgi:hypothetical protein